MRTTAMHRIISLQTRARTIYRAAPEMFAALKRAESLLKLLEKQGRLTNGATLKEIQDAIAKAEGR